MRTIITCTAVLAIGLAGCATRANSVAPISISANEYATLACEDSRSELAAAREKENALTRRQNNAALADAAAVFLVALPLGSVFGADVAGELAEAKGEVLALERHTRDACDRQSGIAPLPAASTVPTPAPAQQPTQQGRMRALGDPSAVKSMPTQ